MRRLVRLYPRHWRARYGAELEAVLERTPATPAAVLDVLRGAALARLTSPRRFRPGYFVGLLLIALFAQFDVLAPLSAGSVALGHRVAFRVMAGPVELWGVNQGGFFSFDLGTGAFVLALLIALVGAFRPVRQTGLRPR